VTIPVNISHTISTYKLPSVRAMARQTVEYAPTLTACSSPEVCGHTTILQRILAR